MTRRLLHDRDRPGPAQPDPRSPLLAAKVIDRRQALSLLGSAGLLVALGGCRGDSDSTVLPTTSAPSTDPGAIAPSTAAGMPQLSSEVSDVHIRLVAAPSTAEIRPGTSTDVWSFQAEVLEGDPATVTPSGSYLGPTLHLRQGQRVRVSFENRLPQESIVHWHGLVVPQDQDGQPSEAVAPGGSYEYDFAVANEPGTYWYHPHPHHLTGEQVYRGLAGLLIVHGEGESLPAGPRDLAFVLQDRTFDADGQLRYVTSNHDRLAGFVGDTLVANGVAGLTVTVERGPYRLRLLNGANSRTQSLTLSTGDGFHVVATDGSLLSDPTRVDALVLTPAQRSDLWIDFSRFEPGQRIDLLAADTFIEIPSMMGGGMGGGGMGGGGTLTLEPKVAMSFLIGDGPATPGEAPQGLEAPLVVDPTAATNTDAPRKFELTTRQASHWINGVGWDGRTASAGEIVAFGTTEIWEFTNLSPMAHPMHLHGEAFQIIERTWASDAGAAAWDLIAGGIVESGPRDTVLVWPGQRVRIAVPFTKHRGYFLYHCHILEHEDGGMMRNFLIQ